MKLEWSKIFEAVEISEVCGKKEITPDDAAIWRIPRLHDWDEKCCSGPVACMKDLEWLHFMSIFSALLIASFPFQDIPDFWNLGVRDCWCMKKDQAWYYPIEGGEFVLFIPLSISTEHFPTVSHTGGSWRIPANPQALEAVKSSSCWEVSDWSQEKFSHHHLVAHDRKLPESGRSPAVEWATNLLWEDGWLISWNDDDCARHINRRSPLNHWPDDILRTALKGPNVGSLP